MDSELTDLQKLDCKTAPYQGAIYRKMRRISKSHVRVFGSSGEGTEGQEYAYRVPFGSGRDLLHLVLRGYR